MGVVQELKTDTFVTLTVKGGSVIETFYAFKAINDTAVGFLVIEIILAEVGIRTAIFLSAE